MKICYSESTVYWINGGNLGCGAVRCVGVLVCRYFINCLDRRIVAVIPSCGSRAPRIGIYPELNSSISTNRRRRNTNCSPIVASWKTAARCPWVRHRRVGPPTVCRYRCVSIETLGLAMRRRALEAPAEPVTEPRRRWEGGSWVPLGRKGLPLRPPAWEARHCGSVDLRYIISNPKPNSMRRTLINDLKPSSSSWCYQNRCWRNRIQRVMVKGILLIGQILMFVLSFVACLKKKGSVEV